MFVKDRMTPNPIFGSPDMAVTEAQELMAENKIRHLPILDKDQKLVGLITQKSLESALPLTFPASADLRSAIPFLNSKSTRS